MNTDYRTITLHQPWASLVALGLKKYILRSEANSYRGKLLIYSAKKKYDPNALIQHPTLGMIKTIKLVESLFDLSRIGRYHCDLLSLHGASYFPHNTVVACVMLSNCYKPVTNVTEDEPITDCLIKQICGDWRTDKQYAWELDKPRMLPYLTRGSISVPSGRVLYVPDAAIVQEVEDQLQFS